MPGIAFTCVGRTTTLVTGGRCTTTVAMPDFPLTLAAIWVDPMARPWTTPDADTLAMAVSRTVQTIAGCGTSFPSTSVTTACNGNCVPTISVVDGGFTATVATGAPGARVASAAPPHEQTSGSATQKRALRKLRKGAANSRMRRLI